MGFLGYIMWLSYIVSLTDLRLRRPFKTPSWSKTGFVVSAAAAPSNAIPAKGIKNPFSARFWKLIIEISGFIGLHSLLLHVKLILLLCQLHIMVDIIGTDCNFRLLLYVFDEFCNTKWRYKYVSAVAAYRKTACNNKRSLLY